MKIIIIISLFFFFSNCNKPKIAFICGDHECVNKAEANQYFEENFILEVKIIEKKSSKDVDLVELNLKNKNDGYREIKVFSKQNSNKNLKILTEKEKEKIKKDVITKKKVNIKKIKKNKIVNQSKKNIMNNNDKKNKLYVSKQNKNKDYQVKKNIKSVEGIDICSLLNKCNIDEISNYLLKIGKKKSFPDITERQ